MNAWPKDWETNDLHLNISDKWPSKCDPWLQAAAPIEAEGDAGQILPEGDIAWKHFRLCGIRIVLAFAYLEHSIGMTGCNLVKLHKLHELTDEGRTKLIAVGDWNMHPDILRQSGMLELIGPNHCHCRHRQHLQNIHWQFPTRLHRL